MSVLFSGKYNTYGSGANQTNLAAQMEAAGVANHNTFGYLCSIFALNSTSWIASGGVTNLKAGISNVKNIFETVFDKGNGEPDYFSGLGGGTPTNTEEMDVETTNKIMKEFDNYLTRYKVATSPTEKSLCATLLKNSFNQYIENGGNNATLINAFKDIEEQLDLDINNLGDNLKDYDFFSNK